MTKIFCKRKPYIKSRKDTLNSFTNFKWFDSNSSSYSLFLKLTSDNSVFNCGTGISKLCVNFGSWIICTSIYFRYFNDCFMFISNSTNHMSINWYQIICMQSESSGHTLNSSWSVVICIWQVKLKHLFMENHFTVCDEVHRLENLA